MPVVALVQRQEGTDDQGQVAVGMQAFRRPGLDRLRSLPVPSTRREAGDTYAHPPLWKGVDIIGGQGLNYRRIAVLTHLTEDEWNVVRHDNVAERPGPIRERQAGVGGRPAGLA